MLKTLKSYFLIDTDFVTMISISLFYYCKKVFTHVNTGMIGKNLMKHHYQTETIFTVIERWKILHLQIMCMQYEQEFVKILKKNTGEYHDFYIQSNLAEVFENF